MNESVGGDKDLMKHGTGTQGSRDKSSIEETLKINTY